MDFYVDVIQEQRTPRKIVGLPVGGSAFGAQRYPYMVETRPPPWDARPIRRGAPTVVVLGSLACPECVPAPTPAFGQPGVLPLRLLSSTAGAIQGEVSAVVRELNNRNIFAESQAAGLTPEQAVAWGVDFACMQRCLPKRAQGYDAARSRQGIGTVRYPTRQYDTDSAFGCRVQYAIAAARGVVGKPISKLEDAATGSLAGARANLPSRSSVDTLLNQIIGAA